ncbi:unnamed protein product [Polarella glacialis]|uniref:Uncharacterized protein n=1 Tax=Polarella glacialis TaxID=89957 RepID=A0A813JKB7_POLGL|nr:unnamed protein product [Polarella glacialis]|mmetsp:Transcript_36194/g.58417  ORF Transcript_36194/g.58417 Transcript_36194/m.58417 type:complete len:168 (-) Transcript_36194:279-782(-)
MSFCKASRDQYHLTGSDDPSAPDYVKPQMPPPARSQRDAARAAREMAQRGGYGKLGLPKVPLKIEKPRYRTSTIARDMFSVNGAFPAAEPGDRSMADHPLMRFERLGSLKPTGRFRGDDGELAKITSMPYNSEESMQERRVAVRCGKAAQETNSGIGSSIIGGQNTD